MTALAPQVVTDGSPCECFSDRHLDQVRLKVRGSLDSGSRSKKLTDQAYRSRIGAEFDRQHPAHMVDFPEPKAGVG